MYTAISVQGDSNVVKAMKRLAMKRSIKTGESHTVGELVREALAQTYGDDFDEALSFFVERGFSKNHMELDKDTA